MNIEVEAEQGSAMLRVCEKIIADGVVDVATELRLVDPAELASLIRTNQQANLSDLVNSSSELYFKPGTLKYGLMAGCSIGWHGSPVIVFDLEFVHASVSAFFRLVLGRATAAVEIVEIFFDRPDLSSDEKTVRVERAMRDAQVGGDGIVSHGACQPASDKDRRLG
jgi:hypothetical protein